MVINLNAEVDGRIQAKLATGKYKSVEHVLLAALRALDEEEDTIAAITEGIEDVKAGRVVDWEIADAEFREKHGIPKAQ